MNGLLIVLVVCGLVAVTGGVGWIYPPAGAITAGLLMLGTAYVIRYLRARQ
jgi:hypothetical protein